MSGIHPVSKGISALDTECHSWVGNYLYLVDDTAV